MLLLFLLLNPIYLRILFYLATKLWALWSNKCENVHDWKKQKSISKNFKLIFSKTVDLLLFAHDTIQCLKNVVYYLNMKIPDILVGIIDLKLCSSLKWDGV